MTFTLSGAPITSAVVRLPRYGIWTATVVVAGALELAAGASAVLTVGDLTLSGTAKPGGTFAGQAEYTITGGAGRWGARVSARQHRSDAGVTAAQVVADLVLDAGERGAVLEPGADRPLGYAWARAAGIASDALAQVAGVAWWVAPDGITHVGTRPAATLATTLGGLAYEPRFRRATVAIADDAVAQFAPGATLVHSSLPAPLEIGSVVLRISADAVEVDLYGERPASELLAVALEALAARARAGAPLLYQVTDDAQGRTSARAAGASSASMPDVAFVDRVFGLPGARATLQPGALVLVSLLDGSPGAPRVVGYLPGALPDVVGLDAESSIELGASGAAVSLAKMTEVNVALQLVWAGCGGSGPAPQISGTSKVRGE